MLLRNFLASCLIGFMLQMVEEVFMLMVEELNSVPRRLASTIPMTMVTILECVN